MAGISIGAINSTIIAGNPHADRVDRLRSFDYDDAGITLSNPRVLALRTIEQSPAIYDFLTLRHGAAESNPTKEAHHEHAG